MLFKSANANITNFFCFYLGLGGLSATILQPDSMSMTLEDGMGIDDEVMFQPGEDEEEDYSDARIQSPPPVATQLARTLGMPSQRVQIMKASFFETGDNDYIQDVSMGML